MSRVIKERIDAIEAGDFKHVEVAITTGEEALVGYLPEYIGFYEYMTAKENLR
jgi:ABC-type uncharacterized transport system ATPase subunit